MIMPEELRREIENIIKLDDDEYRFVLSCFIRKQFQKHQFLVQEGAYTEHEFFLANGLVKVYQTDDTGKEHIILFAMENNWAADVQAVNNKTKASFNIYCMEPTLTFAITLEDREKLCANLPKMEHFFRKKTISDNILLQRRIMCLISNNATDRYNDLLLHYPELIQRVPKTMIASYLGISRETLSRLLVK